MKNYTYSVDVSDYIIWHGNEIYARISGCTAQAMRVMVTALNQMERLVFLKGCI
jgi:hypothetical protein